LFGTDLFHYFCDLFQTLRVLCELRSTLQVRTNPDTWATPFEVHLAAKKFNCIIHLFHLDSSISGQERQYCFEPETEDPAEQGFKRRPSIFLKSELKNGHFWFQWSQVTTKVSRTNSLFRALHNWLGQDEIRPISAHLLGVDDRDFISKCSKIWRLARAKNTALLDGKRLVVPTRVHMFSS
jgi:hypothetical protein